MSAQDRTEQVLRDIHILLANSELYDKGTNKIIIDKKEMLELLSRLNTSIYDMMDEYGLTEQGRDRAEREARKVGEEIIRDASQKAEDVYAASVMYTDEALCHVQNIMRRAGDSIKEIYDRMNAELKQEWDTVRRDQSDLKSHLQNLTDTDKYLNLIDDRNRELEREKAKEKAKKEPSAYASVKPEIKINQEYFEKAGIALDAEYPGEEAEPSEPQAPAEVKVNVNLDAEYFHWKEETQQEDTAGQKPEKHSIFSRRHRGEK